MSSTTSQAVQLDLFGSVLTTYLDGEARTNAKLYEALAANGRLSAEEIEHKVPVGEAAVPFSLVKRRIRWYQQTLREKGVLERVPGQRGTWRLAERDKNDLTKAPPSVVMIAFSTDLGVALWGSCLDTFGAMTESIAVCITSPPYPLAKPRAYGNPSQDHWVDWLCRQLEPIVKRLLTGGSIAVNLSNDVFVPGLPSRSLYREKFVIAMAERLGMHKMDELVWDNPSKPPGPFQWASRQRMQLNAGYEPVLVFCNDPIRSFADNRRVYEPHTDTHQRLIAAGGERRRRSNSDGSYIVVPGAYGNRTPGRIPKNVLRYGTSCSDQRQVRRMAQAAGLPTHGASMPLALAVFLVKYLSRPGDLVVDPFGGTMTTAKACQLLDRLWMSSELVAEYAMAGRFRFDQAALKAGLASIRDNS